MAEGSALFSAEEMERVARLAHLRLEADEMAPLAAKLEAVLAYMHVLDRLNLDGVPPTDHASAAAGSERPDEARPGLDVDSALHNAPERIGDGFGVPKIIE